MNKELKERLKALMGKVPSYQRVVVIKCKDHPGCGVEAFWEVESDGEKLVVACVKCERKLVTVAI